MASNISIACVMPICYIIVHFPVCFFFFYLRDIHILSSKNNVANTCFSMTGQLVVESVCYATLLGRGQ